MLMKYADKLKRKVKYAYLTRFAKIEKDPIIVLGHQKAGTSAIAVLLAKATGVSATIDMFQPNRASLRFEVFDGEIPLSEFIQKNRLYFSTKIIKEPNLTFLYDELLETFPRAKFVFVVRDPRDNIRSILNRLKIAGDRETLDAKEIRFLSDEYMSIWQAIIDGRMPKTRGDTYIEKLAHRWVVSAQEYRQHRNNMVLVKYEDFLLDKQSKIAETADKVGLPVKFDITDDLETNFQPPGNRNVKWHTFFGDQNLSRIEAITHQEMIHFGYEI